MARTSSICHPPSEDFFIIRANYVALFDDFCCAALLAAFEYWHNGELVQIHRGCKEGEPLIEARISDIEGEMLGMYSNKPIVAALKRLHDAGLIVRTSKGRGDRGVYRFEVSAINEAIKKKRKFGKTTQVPTTHFSTEVVEKGVEFSGKTTLVEGSYPLCIKNKNIEELYIGEKISESAPETTQKDRTHLYEDIDSERFQNISVENLTEWVYILFTEMEIRTPTPPSRKHQQTMVDRIADRGKEKVVEEIHNWFEAGNKSLDKLIASWKPSFSQRRGVESGARSNGGYRAMVGQGSGSSNRPSSSYREKQYSSEKPDPPLEAKAWNERVSTRKWEFWSPTLHQSLQERLGDPDFIKCYDRMLDKCAAIAEVNHKMGQYVTFAWLLKDDNWMRLINGECDFALKVEKSKRAEVETSMEELIRHREKEKNK